jgi:membrane fusion protein, multidrug efflux system
MNFKKSSRFLLTLLSMFVLSMAAPYGTLRAEDNAIPQGTKCPKQVAVVLETVKAGVFMEYQYFSCQGHAEIVPIKSPVNGVLSEIKVSEGSLVDMNQELAVLNAGMSEQVKKLEAAAASAKKTLAARQGWKIKSEKAIESAAKEYQKALDLLNKAKAQVNQVVKAPVAGIVHLVMVAGSQIAADALLLEISNPKQMIFQVPLAAADKGSLAVGNKFIATTEGFSGEVAAEVVAVSDAQVTFRVNNDGNQFREGIRFMFKRLKAEHAEVIIIPSAAVQKDSLGEFIYIAEKKKAKKMYVTIGASSEGKTIVEKGLGAGASLIVSGFDCLVDGKKIRIVNEEDLAKEKAEALTKLKEKLITEPEVKTETPTKTKKPFTRIGNQFRVGLIFGRFSINDKNLRAFSGQWFKNIPGIEFSVHTLYNVDVWASYKTYTNNYTTTVYKNETKFKLVPISIGLRYRFPKWRFVEPFVGAGLNFYSFKETISGETDLKDTSDSATGFHFQGGTYLHIKHFRNLQGEIFLKYNMVKKTLADALPDGTNKFDLGGFEMGIGLVARF